MDRIFFYGLIFLSGVSGLIYEVVWHRYLSILLGAQARATSIVLAIFMGGISLGYAVFGRWTRTKKWNLFLVYGLVELGLGIWAVLFPFFYQLAAPFTSHLYAMLGLGNIFIDIFVSLLLIGPPTFLMGGTLPLLTQGLSEDLSKASRTHALIYGINTFGACLGSALTGYYLIPNGGLRTALYVGAVLNGAVAAAVTLIFARRYQLPAKVSKLPPFKFQWALTPNQAGLFGIGFISGFFLITLQTILIRLIGLSTGSANYNFTLIVTIFIFGLGVGSILCRRIADFTIWDLVRNQLAIMFTVLALYFSGDYWSYIVHLTRVMFRDIPEAFYTYQLAMGGVFTLILAIPIGLAGFTLPLCFHLLKDKPESLGQRVGQLYGLNTVGCVLGALIGGYWLFNFWNIDQLFKFCVFLCIVSASIALYLYLRETNFDWKRVAMVVTPPAVCAVIIFFAPLYSKERFIQPFRHPSPITGVTFEGAKAFGESLGRNTKYVVYKDGPNTSVGVGASSSDGAEVSRSIFVNGKSDGNTRGDFFTTVILAHLPGLLAPNLDHVGVIGFGTGTTIGTIAKYPLVKAIDVADISGTILDNAREFDAYNGGVSTNPKVHLHEMDAFRYFEGTEGLYNVIISEPSNPWVAGIENLYSQEFYKMAHSKLAGDGMLVQWIHTYSFNDKLLKMVLHTMNSVFPNVSVFQLKAGDIALVASKERLGRKDILRAANRWSENPAIVEALLSSGITRLETLLALEIVTPDLSKAMGENAELHTLENPKLSNEAAKAFFVGSSSRIGTLRKEYKQYFASVPGSLLALTTNGEMPNAALLRSLQSTFCDNAVSRTEFMCEDVLAAIKVNVPAYDPLKFYESSPNARDLASLSRYGETPKGLFNAEKLQEAFDMFEVYRKYYSPIAQIPAESFFSRLNYCLKIVPEKTELYGECLLQKILALETIRPRDAEFKKNASQFLDWFQTITPDTSNYKKLQEARDILVRMMTEPG